MLLILYILSLAPPTNVQAVDKPNDAGSAIDITWDISLDDQEVEKYLIFRQTLPDTAMEMISFLMRSSNHLEDDDTDDTKEYIYFVAASKNSELVYSKPSNTARSFPQFFHTGRTNVLLSMVVFTCLLIYFIIQTKKGKKFLIRKIPGLEAVDDAVGRATEMGKPILYIPGLGDIDWTATIASMNILGEVAKKIALYDTPLIVCNRWSVVYTVSKEVVKEAFITEGRPDKFQEDYVRYLTEAQFGFAAAVNGIMLRERPATNFFIGRFWAESLIIAETGAQTGAIQIAGSDSVLQLPFFVAACDYTLICEELYAASAYLSHEPLLMSSLKAQDYGKIIVLVILLIFTILSFFSINLLNLLTVQ